MDYAQQRFESLVHAYSTDLYRFAYWLCRNRAQAEDLVQETFLRAWRALDSLRDEYAAKSWLLTILRREYARKPASHLTGDEPSSELPGLNPDGVEAWQVRRALQALPLEYREPLLLQILGGYDCREIAAMLEISTGAVMTRLFRARQKMRAALEPDRPAAAIAEVIHELP